MKNRFKYCLIALFVLFQGFLFSLSGEVLVARVVDGDTYIFVNRLGNEIRCRMYGIDAPEMKQDFGKKSKDNLSKMIEKQTVRVELVDIDRYGRAIVKTYLNDADIGLVMIESGSAWHYWQYSKEKSKYQKAQKIAKSRSMGLWRDKKAVAPWEFRKKK